MGSDDRLLEDILELREMKARIQCKVASLQAVVQSRWTGGSIKQSGPPMLEGTDMQVALLARARKAAYAVDALEWALTCEYCQIRDWPRLLYEKDGSKADPEEVAKTILETLESMRSVIK